MRIGEFKQACSMFKFQKPVFRTTKCNIEFSQRTAEIISADNLYCNNVNILINIDSSISQTIE